MNILNKTFGWLCLLAGIVLPSCERSLDDINLSPNTLPDREIDIKYVLTGVITQSARISADVMYAGGELSAATQYLQRDFTSYEENNYEWGGMGFSKYYKPIKDSDYIYQRAETEKEGEEKDYYQAVSLIMKAYWYGFLTSAYGDIPYSKAMQAEKGGDEFFKPAYDSQKEVFTGVLEDLKQANELLKSVTICKSAVDADVMYRGDGLKWRKFANSLRLRYNMRLSEKSDAGVSPAAEIKMLTGNVSEYPLMVGNDDNAAIRFIGSDVVNSWLGGPLNYSLRSEFYRRKPASTIVNKLIELKDPRLTAWIRPVDVQIAQGTANEVVSENGVVKRYTNLNIGEVNKDDNLENDINTAMFVGLGIALTSPNEYNLAGSVSLYRDRISSLDGGIYLGEASNPHVSYLSDRYAQNTHQLAPWVLMSCAEVKFLLAEATYRKWIDGSALDYYLSGAKLSIEQHGVGDGDARAVYDKEANTLVSFDMAGYLSGITEAYERASDKLAPIMDQKWIALWMSAESWFDWRRTGLPDLNQHIISGSRGKNTPLRFWYEDAFNEKEMLDAVSRLDPAVNNQWSKMWLLQ